MKPKDVENLYRLFGHRVYQRCIYLLREESAAMDMVQETFLSLLNSRVKFPDDRHAVAWLLKVATNKTFNEFRRRKYWRSEAFEEFRGTGAEDPFPGINDRLLFQRALLSLKGDKASIVVSYFQEGRTLAETAEESGYSVPTVRRTVHGFLDKVEKLAQKSQGA